MAVTRTAPLKNKKIEPLINRADGQWIAQQHSVLDGEAHSDEPNLTSDTSVKGYNQMVNITPGQSSFGGTIANPHDLEVSPSFLMTLDPQFLVSIKDPTLNAPRSSHDLSSPYRSVVEPAGLGSFIPYRETEDPNVCVRPSTGLLSPVAVDLTSRGCVQSSKAAWVSTWGQDHQGATTEQNEMHGRSGPRHYPAASMPGLTSPHQETETHKRSVAHANSTQDWLAALALYAMRDPEGQDWSQEMFALTRWDSNDVMKKTGSRCFQSLATSASSSCTDTAKASCGPNAPGATLKLPINDGKVTIPRLQKALSRDTCHGLHGSQQVRNCFRCKIARCTVRASGYVKHEHSTSAKYSQCRGSSLASDICERCMDGRLPATQMCFQLDLSDCGFFRTGKRVGCFSMILTHKP